MRLDFFRNLPPEIIIYILSRLPIKTILMCKCVCKSWVDLIESAEFSELHLSKSVMGLAACQCADPPKPYTVVEFVDDLHLKNSSHYFNVLFRFNFNTPDSAHLHSSVNGLLLMYEGYWWSLRLYVCNPITRDYFELPLHPSPPENVYSIKNTLGFGVSKMTGQYKLIMISLLIANPPQDHQAFTEYDIYTLGTRSWRSILVDNPLNYVRQAGVFLNGNLHWLADSKTHPPLISCFDLETELFTTFSSPPNRPHDPDIDSICCLSALGNCLCVCDSVEEDIIVWLMKEYGDGKSWTKEYIINVPIDIGLSAFNFPVKVFGDGDILIVEEEGLAVFCYSNKAGTIQESCPFGWEPPNFFNRGSSMVFYTPSFLSVKMFPMENVCSL